MTSVNTNFGAMVALQNLNATQKAMDMTQSRINTGLKVAGARDNGAVFAIAQDQRSRVSSINILREAMDRAISTVDVGIEAGQAVGELLMQMKDKAMAAAAPGLTTEQIATYNSDFVALRDQIDDLIGSATFNGANIANATGSNLLVLVDDRDLTNVVTVTQFNLTATGLGVNATTFTTSALAATAVGTVSTAMATLNTALTSLGAKSKALTVQKDMMGKLADQVEKGVGSLVDADMAREAARLQSLQVKQQLGAQALSIANQSPQIIMSFFGR